MCGGADRKPRVNGTEGLAEEIAEKQGQRLQGGSLYYPCFFCYDDQGGVERTPYFLFVICALGVFFIS